jgi:hypothetical protein
VESVDPTVVCITAFAVVLLALALLAAAMHLITLAFPERALSPDTAIVAAVSSTVAALIPGARVTRIEEGLIGTAVAAGAFFSTSR